MNTDLPKRKIWVGFDLGGTKMMAVVFDDKLKVLGKKRRKTRGSAGEQVGLERLAETITLALTEAGATLDEARGCLATALRDMAETNLLRGESLPLPNPLLSDAGCELEEPIYLVFRTGQTLVQDVAVSAP